MENKISVDMLYQSISYLEDVLIYNLKKLCCVSECMKSSNENRLAIEKIKCLNEILIDEISRERLLPEEIKQQLINKSVEIRILSSKIEQMIEV